MINAKFKINYFKCLFCVCIATVFVFPNLCLQNSLQTTHADVKLPKYHIYNSRAISTLTLVPILGVYNSYRDFYILGMFMSESNNDALYTEYRGWLSGPDTLKAIERDIKYLAKTAETPIETQLDMVNKRLKCGSNMIKRLPLFPKFYIINPVTVTSSILDAYFLSPIRLKKVLFEMYDSYNRHKKVHFKYLMHAADPISKITSIVLDNTNPWYKELYCRLAQKRVVSAAQVDVSILVTGLVATLLYGVFGCRGRPLTKFIRCSFCYFVTLTNSFMLNPSNIMYGIFLLY